MKFTKVIAEALARKTKDNLFNEQQKFIKEYTLPKDKLKDLTKLILEYEDIAKRKKILIAEYEAKFKKGYRDWIFEGKSKEEIIRIISEEIATREYEIPSLDTLIDDFLILSIDAIDTEDLINKVTAKYAKQ